MTFEGASIYLMEKPFKVRGTSSDDIYGEQSAACKATVDLVGSKGSKEHSRSFNEDCEQSDRLRYIGSKHRVCSHKKCRALRELRFG